MGLFSAACGTGVVEYPIVFDVGTIVAEDTAVVCFAKGTRIATPGGETLVEELRIGDMVSTHDGRSAPVKWVGRRTVMPAFGPPERLQPVRIAASALGDGVPERDLVLTADHALLIDGLLVNADALVNGTTVARIPATADGAFFTVYHIETENHDVILAEGAPTETYVDYVGRQSFDNYAEYAELYGAERTIHEMPYPRVSSARLVPVALRARLAGVRVA